MRMKRVPSRRASRRRFSRLAPRRGQLDVVSTRVPTPGDASANGGVAFVARIVDHFAGDTLPGNIRVKFESARRKQKRNPEKVRARRKSNGETYMTRMARRASPLPV